TTNRPEQRNAQSRRLLEELDEAFATAAEDRGVNVIALFGSGEHFSGGHDLGSADELADREERPLQAGVRGRFDHSRQQFVERTMRWRNLPKPTIAGVQGYCIFAGWMIASAMDIIYAAKDAMFLGSNFQFFNIPWDIHPRKAKELLYESRFIDGTEAKELGLVNRVFAADEVRSAVIAYAERIAKNDPFQLRMMKMAVNHMQDTQGFAGHINAAHTMHMLSAGGERDPDYALKVPEGARRPMVERAFEHFELNKRQLHKSRED
ncbi:MAG: hypothetical protein E2O59_01925, partial [Gammaproteobacteria bacterium]